MLVLFFLAIISVIATISLSVVIFTPINTILVVSISPLRFISFYHILPSSSFVFLIFPHRISFVSFSFLFLFSSSPILIIATILPLILFFLSPSHSILIIFFLITFIVPIVFIVFLILLFFFLLPIFFVSFLIPTISSSPFP